MGTLRWMGRQMASPEGRGGRLMCAFLVMQHAPITRWTMELLDLRPGERLLDIGCGNGVALGMIARRTGEGTVAGIDNASLAVEIATRRNRKEVGAGRVSVTLGEATCLPFPDRSFDKVLALESFYFWGDHLAGLREARRVLKPGGRLSIVMELLKSEADPGKNLWLARKMDCPIFSETELLALLREAGFGPARARWRKAWLCVQASR
ncbi:MAG TPA: class I SAM-dependent methyltransferase [Rectinemataceae bacterium]|nr:class I SAM-dependent methyltransferase [Rectinemataceae bacterium]